MRFVEFMLLILLICVLGMGAYTFWLYFPSGTEQYHPFSSNFTSLTGGVIGVDEYGASNKIVQFYPNMRYTNRNISYRLESACTQNKWDDIKSAFDIISEKTSLSFYHSKENPEIKVIQVLHLKFTVFTL